MSGSFTYKLKGARWLRKYTAPSASPVYAAASDAQNIADTLCDVPWTRADSDGPAMFPQHDAKALDANPGNRDLFDAAAFCAEHVNGSHKVYANAAFYLFALPPAAQGKTLSSVKVHLASDPYNEFGARVAVHLLSSPALPTDCGTVRTGVAHADGQVPRTVQTIDGVAYWYGASGDVPVTLLQDSVTTAYLGVFVGLENYARARGDWIEGASYIRNSVEIETTEEITGWTSDSTETIDCSDAGVATLLAGGSSPTWLQPLPTVNAGVDAPPVPTGLLIERFFAAQSKKVAQRYVRTVGFRTTGWEGTVTLNYLGNACTGGTVAYKDISTGTAHTGVLTAYNTSQSSTFRPDWNFISPEWISVNGYVDYLYVNIRNSAVQMASDGFLAITNPYIVAYDNNVAGAAAHQVTGTDKTEGSFGSQNGVAYIVDNYYVMLEFTDGVPSDAGHCNAQDVGSKRDLLVDIEGSESPWAVIIGNTAYTVTKSGDTITLKQGSTTIKTWTSVFGADTDFFDAAVSLHLSNTNVAAYGLASVLGDFSHAVATFEQGDKPLDTELLGRLARMSRKDAGQMLYLHPESGALADELDVLRPVPRFWRTATDPTGQTACQPGLSVWYRRPTSSSDAAFATGYNDDGTVGSVTKVTNPVFLQLAILALRAPSAFGTRLVLQNFKPDTTTPTTNVATAITNHFKIRFVAWRSPAEQWDGSNAFAMAAMASMPSIYRADGPASVAWSVDCTGGLLRFGTRNMTAERIGISKTIIGEIAASAEIEIPIASPVGEGDVVLIAPEVLGFADGAGGASKWFGRPSDPSLGTAGWARYAHNLGWFPRVTGK